MNGQIKMKIPVLRRNNSKHSLLKITLKIKDKTGGRFTYHSTKTKRIFSIVRQQNFSEAFVKVDYGQGFNNSGSYKNKQDLLFALKAFTKTLFFEGSNYEH